MKPMTEQVSEVATMLKSKENQGFFESLLVRSELESPIAQGHQGLLKEGSKPTNSGAAHVPQSNSPKEKEKGSDQVSPSLDQSYQPTTPPPTSRCSEPPRLRRQTSVRPAFF
jgi:hypothetical protein